MSGQEPPEYPRGGDPRRRWALRDRLYLHRRNARAFDAAAAGYKHLYPEPYEGDWWVDTGMSLGVEGREAAGAVHPWRVAA